MYLEDNRPRVKICGITRLEDARFASGALVDFLGFIFVKDSPRYIDPERAKEIIGWVEGPQTVGVFANEKPSIINAIALESGIHLVQLHGDETPEDCFNINLPVIKAFRVKPEDTVETVLAMIEPYSEVCEYFLLDTYTKEALGGTGKAFNWNIVAQVSEDYPILVAGGINHENVREAVLTARPFGVDISSGVEEKPGIKDFDLIQEVMIELEDIESEFDL